MTIKHKGNQEYEGLSTDTKPVASDTAVNALFTELDTGDQYINNGTAWVVFRGGSNTEVLTNKELDIALNTLKLRLYSYIIFKSGTTYYAITSAGAVLASGAVAETVIQAALNIGGTIFIADGTYDLSAGFTGFTLGTHDKILLGRGVTIRVPQGYTGVMWEFPAPCTGTTLEGGVHGEQGTPQRLWTWIRMNAPTSGVYANIVQDCIISDAAIGIKLLITSTTGWINQNFFKFLKMSFCGIFVDFDYTATYPAASEATGFFANYFTGIYCQSGAMTTYGFKNIRHKRNSFIECHVWDASGAEVTSNLHADSTNNVIIGGIMTYLNFTDASTAGNNLIFDSWSGGLRLGFNKVSMGDGGVLKRHATGVIAVRNAADSAYGNFRADNLQTFNLAEQGGTALANIATSTLTFYDAKNIAFNATTGTKIGTATTQKLGFFNATPVVQQTAVASPTADVTSLKTAVDAIRARLTALGLTA